MEIGKRLGYGKSHRERSGGPGLGVPYHNQK